MSANTTPRFTQSKELARHVPPEDIRGSKVSSAAFMPLGNDTYFSVNNLELETIDTIAEYYRGLFNIDPNDSVSIATRKISKFNDAGRFIGISITYDAVEKKWVFNRENNTEDAYRHRPSTNRLCLSHSHCGVEFINITLDYNNQKKLARRLAGKRPHLIFK